jgi:hypothetical protein
MHDSKFDEKMSKNVLSQLANGGNAMVEQLIHNSKFKGFKPAVAIMGSKRGKHLTQLSNDGNTVVEILTRDSKIKGLKPAAIGTGSKRGKKF